ncbi:MAG: hypothetical protein WBG70_21675 [Spirulinaceae cyanobacterium]
MTIPGKFDTIYLTLLFVFVASILPIWRLFFTFICYHSTLLDRHTNNRRYLGGTKDNTLHRPNLLYVAQNEVNKVVIAAV